MNDLYGNKRVAAVCGSEVLIYGRRQKNGTRPHKETIPFNNPAQALEFARQYDDDQRKNGQPQEY